MEPQDVVLLIGLAGLIGSALGRFALRRIVPDQTVRRRIYPKINWAIGVSLAIVAGTLVSQVLAATEADRGAQVAAIAVVVAVLLAVFGFGSDERSMQA